MEAIEPHYPKGKRGRPPMGLERLLRMYVADQCFSLSDGRIEDSVYDSRAIRSFVGIDLSREDAPDATTLLQFRRLLEQHNLTQVIFDRINAHLQQRGLMLREGTVVDATLIAASPSTKNEKKARDPEMHQAKKGNQWYFGMKAHIGADVVTGLVHTVKGTAANVSDVSQVPELLHGEEASLHGDAGYIGAEKRLNGHRPETHIARKRGTVRAMQDGPERDQVRADERQKAQLRSIVEHPFHVLKNLFGYRKVRYRGLKKNTAQLHSLFALANLYRARRWGLLPQG